MFFNPNFLKKYLHSYKKRNQQTKIKVTQTNLKYCLEVDRVNVCLGKVCKLLASKSEVFYLFNFYYGFFYILL